MPGGPAQRLPSLDGLRAISIALVICAHATGTDTLGVRFSHWRIAALGGLGVNIFFVISGYLITHLLLQEFNASGRISLKGFYVRRVLRICPAFYVFVAIMVLVSQLGFIAIEPGDLLSALTYTMNFRATASWYVVHLWSLSVEAQFYLVWPLALFLLGRSRAVLALGALLVALPLIRLGTVQFMPAQQDWVLVVFRDGTDALATGCFFACLGHWLGTQQAYARFLRSPAILLAPACVVLAQVVDPSFPVFSLTIGQTVKNVAIALCLEHCVRCPQDVAGRILNSRTFVFFGVLSYSMYLWQQPFMNRQVDCWATSFPLNVVITVIVAAGSYYLVERPFLKLRKLFRRAPILKPDTG